MEMGPNVFAQRMGMPASPQPTFGARPPLRTPIQSPITSPALFGAAPPMANIGAQMPMNPPTNTLPTYGGAPPMHMPVQGTMQNPSILNNPNVQNFLRQRMGMGGY